MYWHLHQAEWIDQEIFHIELRLSCFNLIFNGAQSNMWTDVWSCGRLSLQDISCNEITALPRHIGRLKALRELNVRRNLLCVLPEGAFKEVHSASSSAAAVVLSSDSELQAENPLFTFREPFRPNSPSRQSNLCDQYSYLLVLQDDVVFRRCVVEKSRVVTFWFIITLRDGTEFAVGRWGVELVWPQRPVCTQPHPVRVLKNTLNPQCDLTVSNGPTWVSDTQIADNHRPLELICLGG